MFVLVTLFHSAENEISRFRKIYFSKICVEFADGNFSMNISWVMKFYNLKKSYVIREFMKFSKHGESFKVTKFWEQKFSWPVTIRDL